MASKNQLICDFKALSALADNEDIAPNVSKIIEKAKKNKSTIIFRVFIFVIKEKNLNPIYTAQVECATVNVILNLKNSNKLYYFNYVLTCKYTICFFYRLCRSCKSKGSSEIHDASSTLDESELTSA